MFGLAFMLFFATPTQRVIAIGSGVMLTFLFLAVLPSNALHRLGNLFGEEHEEAKESGESRSYLFKTSLRYTYQHPLFGVGPGQFPNYEGQQRVTEGKVGNWHETHCVFTEVSAENGIPALIFFLGALVAAVVPVLRVHKKARKMGNVEVKNACFCFLLGTLSYLVAVTFLSHAYSFYFPVLIGMAGTLSFVANQQLEARGGAQMPPRPLAPNYA
jgi:O-antigen ligase